MKNDIMNNMEDIINPAHISEIKFSNVMKNYKNEFDSIKEVIENLSRSELKLATTEGNTQKTFK